MLSAVDIVAAEDTRVTRHLLAHYGIEAKIVSLREHNEARQAQWLVEQIQTGCSVALVSDAGTPGISDPGAGVVRRARAAGVNVWPVPGACALTAALSVLGWERAHHFAFFGFLPARGGDRFRMLKALAIQHETFVLYEAPHRIAETLDDLIAHLAAERPAGVFRELTKKFEQVQFGTLAELRAWMEASENHRRGEFVLIVQGADEVDAGVSVDASRLLSLLTEHVPVKEAVRICAEVTGRKRNALYDLALQLKSRSTTSIESND